MFIQYVFSPCGNRFWQRLENWPVLEVLCPLVVCPTHVNALMEPRNDLYTIPFSVYFLSFERSGKYRRLD